MNIFPLTVAALLLLTASCATPADSSALPMECPAVKDQSHILRHYAYTLSYNEDMRIPEWVAWELESDEVDGHYPREDSFNPDPDWKGAQADNRDYTRSGYTRGHMAPAGDMKFSQEAMRESFYMTNVCPQLSTVNAGNWNSLEEKCRRLAHKYGAVKIVCGPIVSSDHPKTIGWNDVVVPDAFFKVLLVEYRGKWHGVGFIFPHDESNERYETLAMTIDDVEKATGLDFFPSLPDDIENAVESAYDWTFWK